MRSNDATSSRHSLNGKPACAALRHRLSMTGPLRSSSWTMALKSLPERWFHVIGLRASCWNANPGPGPPATLVRNPRGETFSHL